MENDVLS